MWSLLHLEGKREVTPCFLSIYSKSYRSICGPRGRLQGHFSGKPRVDLAHGVETDIIRRSVQWSVFQGGYRRLWCSGGPGVQLGYSTRQKSLRVNQAGHLLTKRGEGPRGGCGDVRILMRASAEGWPVQPSPPSIITSHVQPSALVYHFPIRTVLAVGAHTRHSLPLPSSLARPLSRLLSRWSTPSPPPCRRGNCSTCNCSTAHRSSSADSGKEEPEPTQGGRALVEAVIFSFTRVSTPLPPLRLV